MLLPNGSGQRGIAGMSGLAAVPTRVGGHVDGVVPIRLRTPSGKTGLFYANADAVSRGSLAAPIFAGSDSSVTGEAAWQVEPPSSSQRLATAASEEDIGAQGDAVGGIKLDAQSQFCVGDVVYRHGELASVVHVDSTLHPASYVVRMQETDQEVSCEAEHLQLVGSSDEGAPDELQNSSLAPTPSQDNHTVPVQSFADAVQMQYLQHAALLNQAPLSEQHLQQLQYLHMQQMLQLQKHQLSGLTFGREACDAPMENSQQVYAAAGLPGFGPESLWGESNFAGLPATASHCENHALKEAAEALDRAEISMLTGGRVRCSSPPEHDLENGDWMRYSSCGSNFALKAAAGALGTVDGISKGASSNFALKAAADALGALDQDSSLAGRLGGAAVPVSLLDTAHEDADLVSQSRLARMDPVIECGKQNSLASRIGLAAGVDAEQNTQAAADMLQLEEELAAAAVTRSISPQVPSTCSDHIPLGGEAFGFSPNHGFSGRAAASFLDIAVAGTDEDDDELERIAQQEMEEDYVIDFPMSLPPKPPRNEFQAQRPGSSLPAPQHPTVQKGPALPVGPRCSLPAGRRPSTKAKSKYQDRDAIVSLILGDDPPSRATTPKGGSRATTPRSTPRGSSNHRGSSKPRTPMTGSRRSQSYDIYFDAGGHAPPSGMKPAPGQLSSLDAFAACKTAPHMLDILNLPGVKAPNQELGSPRRSEASSASSLPQLSEKRPPRKQLPAGAPHAPKPARKWRDSAASFYAS